jgi:hypothetical protein
LKKKRATKNFSKLWAIVGARTLYPSHVCTDIHFQK